MLCAVLIAPTAAGEKSTEHKAETGVIYAKPENLKSNIPLSKILGISAYFANLANKVKIQFASDGAIRPHSR